jgi:hypothetical protein
MVDRYETVVKRVALYRVTPRVFALTLRTINRIAKRYHLSVADCRVFATLQFAETANLLATYGALLAPAGTQAIDADVHLLTMPDQDLHRIRQRALSMHTKLNSDNDMARLLKAYERLACAALQGLYASFYFPSSATSALSVGPRLKYSIAMLSVRSDSETAVDSMQNWLRCKKADTRRRRKQERIVAARIFLDLYIRENPATTYRGARTAAKRSGHKISPVAWRWARHRYRQELRRPAGGGPAQVWHLTPRGIAGMIVYEPGEWS